MGRIPGTTLYRNVKYWPNAIVIPGVLIVRFDSELFFGNSTYFADMLKVFQQNASLQLVDGVSNVTRVIVMDMSSVDQIDSSALVAIKDIHDTLVKNNIKWYFANTREEIFKTLQAGWIIKDTRIPASHFYRHVHPAVQAAANYIKEEILLVKEKEALEQEEREAKELREQEEKANAIAESQEGTNAAVELEDIEIKENKNEQD